MEKIVFTKKLSYFSKMILDNSIGTGSVCEVSIQF
jgi:hypothetical protein